MPGPGGKSSLGAGVGGETPPLRWASRASCGSPRESRQKRQAASGANTPWGDSRVLGVDDWVLRKGSTYGSILVNLEQHRVVNLEQHRVVELLTDRSAPTVLAWLRRHPGIAVIARDRSTQYARASTLGDPDAQQVAGRWDFLLNARQMMELWLTGAHPRLRALPGMSSGDAAPARRHTRFSRTHAAARAREESQAQRVAAYDAVRRRYLAGSPC
nr:transposase [Corallococcus sp. CA053C]